ncbi:MAG: hypothetical protein WCP58_09920 [bacterium]
MGIGRFHPQTRLRLLFALAVLMTVTACTSFETFTPLSPKLSTEQVIDPAWIALLTSAPTPPVQEIVAYTDAYYDILSFHISEDGRYLSYYLLDRFPGKEKGQVIQYDRTSNQQKMIWVDPNPTRLLRGPVITWSPDGRTLSLENYEQFGVSDLRLVDLKSGSQTQCPTKAMFLGWNPFTGLPLFWNQSGKEARIVSTPVDRWAPSPLSPPFPGELPWRMNSLAIWAGQECFFQRDASYSYKEVDEYWSFNFQTQIFSRMDGAPFSGHEDRLLIGTIEGKREKWSEYDVDQIWLKEGADTRLLFTRPPGSSFEDVIGWLNADEFLFRISFNRDETALCVCRILPRGVEVRKLYAWEPSEPVGQHYSFQLGPDQALWGLATPSFSNPARESIIHIPLP